MAPSATASGADASKDTARNREHNQGNQDRKYTPEQKAAVLRIRKCKPTDFYEILDIEAVRKTCTEAEIKKAYRKQSLLTHPDKNGHEHADEAFKMVARAFSVLGDKEKRDKYDRFGGDPDSRFSQAQAQAQNPFGGFGQRQAAGGGMGGGMWENELSPEEMFQRFFGGGGFGGGGPFGGEYKPKNAYLVTHDWNNGINSNQVSIQVPNSSLISAVRACVCTNLAAVVHAEGPARMSKPRTTASSTLLWVYFLLSSSSSSHSSPRSSPVAPPRPPAREWFSTLPSSPTHKSASHRNSTSSTLSTQPMLNNTRTRSLGNWIPTPRWGWSGIYGLSARMRSCISNACTMRLRDGSRRIRKRWKLRIGSSLRVVAGWIRWV